MKTEQKFIKIKKKKDPSLYIYFAHRPQEL
jgi:hypothetical protein